MKKIILATNLIFVITLILTIIFFNQSEPFRFEEQVYKIDNSQEVKVPFKLDISSRDNSIVKNDNLIDQENLDNALLNAVPGYLGISTMAGDKNFDELSNFIKQSNQRPKLYMFFVDFETDLTKMDLDGIYNRGMLPVISLEPWHKKELNNDVLLDIKSAKYNRYFDEFFEILNSKKYPIF